MSAVPTLIRQAITEQHQAKIPKDFVKKDAYHKGFSSNAKEWGVSAK